MTNNTSSAAGFDAAGFSAFLSNPAKEIAIDLSNATVVEVIQAHVAVMQRSSPGYNKSSLIYNIHKLEDVFKCTLMPYQINDIFYSYWVQYLLSQGCCYETIKVYCDQLCASLRWGMRHQCPVSETFDKYKIPKSTKTKVALTNDEISHIYHYNINAIKKSKIPNRMSKSFLRRVRDMFVLACNLGQRYSDMIRITPEHFDDTKDVLTIIQQKTNAKSVVHISELAIDSRVTHKILRKYNYYAPKTGSIVNNYNNALHFLLETIGEEFNDPIRTETKVNGKIELTLKPKHKMVTSRTARRTFITNAILRKIPEIKVRKASGHADGRHFETYCILD